MRARGAVPEPERLLRWYPRDWRRRNGAVMVATWQEQAEAGRSFSAPDARSMRVHGLAERLSPGVGVVLALTGSVAAALGFGGLITSSGAALQLGGLLSFGVAPLLLSLALVTLVRGVAAPGAASTVLTTFATVGAWISAALTAFSWGIDFEQPGTAIAPTLFPAFFLTALVCGSAALTGPIAHGLRGLRHEPLRWAAAIACAVPAALLIGVVSRAPGSVLLAAPPVLVACLWRWRTHHAGTRRSSRVDQPTG